MAAAKVNKSQAIRDYVSANRSASAKDVVMALGKKNVVVTAAMVANVKSKAGLTKRRRGRPAKATKKRSASRKSDTSQQHVDGLSVEMLVEAKRLIRKAGSAKKAVQAIRTIEKLDMVAG